MKDTPAMLQYRTIKKDNPDVIILFRMGDFYETFDEDGNRLNKADYLIEEEVKPNQAKNFIEQYLGLVDLYSQKLKISLVSVSGLKKKKNH